MHIGVPMYSGVDVHLYTYMHRSEVNVRRLPQASATMFPRQSFSLTLELTNCLDWLPSRLQRLPRTGVLGEYHCGSFALGLVLRVVLGIAL